jgi:capsule polysaccharide export protein KpsE/RkpR
MKGNVSQTRIETQARFRAEASPHPGPDDISPRDTAPLQKRLVYVQRLRLLWEARTALGRAAATGLLAGTLLAFLIPKRFESTTQLMPPDGQSNSGMAMLAALTGKAGGGGMGSVAGDLLGVKNSGALFIGILGSSTVQDRLIERFDLKRVYGSRLEREARRKLAENTLAFEDRNSGIISITASDGDPKRAAALAQAYVEELNHLVAELSTSAAHRERVFLEERLAAVKRNLDQASKQFSQFASKNTAIDIKEQGKAMIDAAATLMGQSIATESELRGLEQIYTSNNVRVRSVQARLTELHEQLQKLDGKPGQTSSAAEETDSPYPTLRNLPLLGVTFADLYRETKVQETVYETLTEEYEMAKVQEAKEMPSVKVLDPAKVPERQSYPPRLVIMMLCTMLALMGSTVWILGEARWEQIDAEDPGKTFTREVFQTVNARMPWATPNGSRFQAMTHRVWTRFDRRSVANPNRPEDDDPSQPQN